MQNYRDLLQILSWHYDSFFHIKKKKHNNVRFLFRMASARVRWRPASRVWSKRFYSSQIRSALMTSHDLRLLPEVLIIRFWCTLQIMNSRSNSKHTAASSVQTQTVTGCFLRKTRAAGDWWPMVSNFRTVYRRRLKARGPSPPAALRSYYTHTSPWLWLQATLRRLTYWQRKSQLPSEGPEYLMP